MTGPPNPSDQRRGGEVPPSPATGRRARAGSISRKVGVLLIGLPVVALGIVLVPLPGPGTLVILAGLAILSLEFDWADRWSTRIRAEAKDLFNRITGRG